MDYSSDVTDKVIVLIVFKNKKLRDDLSDERRCTRRYGKEMARKLRVRLEAIDAADDLSTFWPANSKPERCHELKGNLKGCFSMDLVQPYRLLFIPIHQDGEEPPPELAGLEYWRTVKSVEITGIENTHG